jgi:hypothetical protein
MTPYEVLVQCTIGDLYFVHERATRIAAWNMFLLGGISGGSLISGYITQVSSKQPINSIILKRYAKFLTASLGYRLEMDLRHLSVFFGVFIPMVFFFVPETAYIRDPIERRLTSVNLQGSDNDKPAAKDEKEAPNKSALSPEQSVAKEQKDSYLKSLRFMTGKQYTTAPFWKILIRPVVIFWYPGVLWGFLIYGVTLTWIIVFSVVNAQIFGMPPYNFSPSQIGLISLSPLIMTIVGLMIAGPLNDFICLYLAKKNHGIYEPEFRLVLMFPVLILGIVGFFGFGATLHYKTHWIGPVLCFGIANLVMTFETGCVFGYIIDSYEDLSEEGSTLHFLRCSLLTFYLVAFVAINARNLLTFGLTYFVNDWVTNEGPLNVFNVLGSSFSKFHFLGLSNAY